MTKPRDRDHPPAPGLDRLVLAEAEPGHAGTVLQTARLHQQNGVDGGVIQNFLT